MKMKFEGHVEFKELDSTQIEDLMVLIEKVYITRKVTYQKYELYLEEEGEEE